MTSERITTNERKQLIWMAYFFLRNRNGGLIPTDTEMGDLIGYKSRGAVSNLVNALVSEGWFKPRQRLARTLLPLRIQTDVYTPLGDIAKAIWDDATENG